MHGSRARPPLGGSGCSLPGVPLSLLRVRPLIVLLVFVTGLVVREERVLVPRWRISGGSSSGRRSGRTRAGGSVTYSPTEWRSIEPVARKAAEQAVSHPERRDLFLCHAWDDRESSAAELCNSLESSGASVWFSEKDVPLGTLLIREIDRGLRNSRIGIVLVTPALLKSIEQEGIAEKELSALLATDRVIPVAHGTTFEALREVSPLLASRSGLSTADSSLAEVAAKVAAAAAALGDIDA
jgi:hypothetical protein